MDKLADRLREDAADIEARVSPELDYRLRASLEGVTPARPETTARRHSPLFWWASSLTGLAAAIALIAIVNLPQEEPVSTPVAALTPEFAVPELPAIPLNAEAAMITSPLEKELDDLRADMEKARRAVSEDVRQIL